MNDTRISKAEKAASKRLFSLVGPLVGNPCEEEWKAVAKRLGEAAQSKDDAKRAMAEAGANRNHKKKVLGSMAPSAPCNSEPMPPSNGPSRFIAGRAQRPNACLRRIDHVALFAGEACWQSG